MQINLETALLIDKILVEKNFKTHFPAYNVFAVKYSTEELESIEKLTITNFHSLIKLKHFPNLKELRIVSENYENIYSDENLEGNPLINHIIDFSPISEIENLEVLEIENDINLKVLDISKLKKLKKVSFINNPSFKYLEGLSNLRNLQEVSIYGNNLIGNLNIDEYIKSTEGCTSNLLDINMYFDIVKNRKDNARLLSESYLLGDTFLKFAEKNGFTKYNQIDLVSLNELFSKIKSYYERNNLYSSFVDDETKINFIYLYIKRNIKFAHDQLENRLLSYNEAMIEHGTMPVYLLKRFSTLHNSYKTYYFKRGNCEGIVNLMSFMLNMLGIENVNVHVNDKRSRNISGTNHSIIRVKMNGVWYYSDPGKEQSNGKILMDLDEIELQYNVNSYEKEVYGETAYENHYEKIFNNKPRRN